MEVKGAVVTVGLLVKARRAGACGEGLRYEPGTPISEVARTDLLWLEGRLPDEAKALAAAECAARGLRGVVPISLLGSGSGYGYGSGDGDGYGSGDGDGYGYGDGDGDGYGYGDGDGYGYGYGDGDGYGYGDGDGDGDGASVVA